MTINLKNMSICLLIPMVLLTAPKSEAEANCMQRAGIGPVTIEKIAVGYVQGFKNVDGGNAVYVYYKGRYGGIVKLPLHVRYNLNDSMGGAIYSTLMTALTLGLKVNLYDHDGDNCDDFDAVQILK